MLEGIGRGVVGFGGEGGEVVVVVVVGFGVGGRVVVVVA